ncbi:acyl-CoA dehydrogenase family protein [Nocardioides sp. zg-DK7169]|uniref:acyl-CoA dehydrogenase family protein n=1 Tax=Nocardioides sp. zg-DK7169 TaxID=2736600 RepID=UPI0015539FF8|nr:acyl-CoA dehydrogenase [Nocardioides sp. zg-DK7169]NPC98640.1 acyl-CoA dehydrogenase [Nocardioides sp. zg-DK7169]
MRFSLDDEQRSFATAIDGLLTSADVPAVTRAWGTGDTAPGLALWGRLAELGVPALTVPEEAGGIGASPLDLVVAFELLGRHGVPGPWIESVALAPALLAGTSHEALLADLAEGTARVSVAVDTVAPYALDADSATHVFHAGPSGLSVAEVGGALESVDPSRRLFTVTPGEATPLAEGALDRALDLAALATAAAQVGAADRMLRTAVEYVGQRRQFGRVIGEYQAVKHRLADIKVALDFARPLVHGAALELQDQAATAPRAVSAAKVFATETAHRAGRAALQVHGAIGYTLECDLSIWLLRSRALHGAWGTVAAHRARVLDHLTTAR